MSFQIPILLLKEGSTETKDKSAQRNNITAAKLVTEMVKYSLGPRGMDKMLVDTLGASTLMSSKLTANNSPELSQLVVNAIISILEKFKSN